MMNTKLTLKLNQKIISEAKLYAAEKKLSLSKVVENFLLSVVNKENPDESFQISPFVKSMATGVKIPADIDYKKQYAEFLSEKYK